MLHAARLARGGDEIVPAPRGDGGGGQAEHAVSQRVAEVMVEEQPAVEVLAADLFLDFLELHRANSGYPMAERGGITARAGRRFPTPPGTYGSCCTRRCTLRHCRPGSSHGTRLFGAFRRVSVDGHRAVVDRGHHLEELRREAEITALDTQYLERLIADPGLPDVSLDHPPAPACRGMSPCPRSCNRAWARISRRPSGRPNGGHRAIRPAAGNRVSSHFRSYAGRAGGAIGGSNGGRMRLTVSWVRKRLPSDGLRIEPGYQ